MLIDEVEVIIQAGHGGAGKVAFAKLPMRGPEGGNGGRGGDVYVIGSSDLTLLNQFSGKRQWQAESGRRGERNKKTGRDGRDLEIKLPVGSSVTDQETGEIFEIEAVGQRLKLCSGGLGGRGNFELRSPTRTTPQQAQPGLPGQERRVMLVLKLLADFGLIGLPNAGKSSLLNELTAARAEVAYYPFTTLSPNLGVLDNKVIADIPGLIEGAHSGKGLGVKFLKHIEKVKVLLHCLAVDANDLIKDYQVVREELGKYNPKLLEKPEITLLTKIDLVDQKTLKAKLAKVKQLNSQVLPVSIHDWESVEAVKQTLRKK